MFSLPAIKKFMSITTLSVFFIIILLIEAILEFIGNNSIYTSILGASAFIAFNLFIITILFYVAIKASKYGREAYIAWILILFSQITTIIGNFTYIALNSIFNQVTTPSIADIFYLAYYPLLIIGILKLPTTQTSKNKKYQILLDTGILVVSIALILLVALIIPIIGFHNNIIAVILSSSYVFMDIFLLLTLFYLMFNWFGAVKKNPLILLALSVGTLVFTNLIFIYQFSYGVYNSDGLLNVGWLLSYFLTALAGILYINDKTPVITQQKFSSMKFNWSSYLPILWLLIILILLSWVYLHSHEVNSDILIAGSGIIVTMAFARQIFALKESKQTQKLLQDKQEILEKQDEQLKASLDEKEVLLKEIHHRVKNNMQIISSLLSLQSKYIKDEEDLKIFKESQNRVKSMALIHEHLYSRSNLSRINLEGYIHTLVSGLFQSYGVNQLIKANYDLDNVSLDVDRAISCGLIINELVSNSLKYAFPENKIGEITLSLKRSDDNKLIMIVADNGIGLPRNLDYRKTDSLGLQLVTALVEQIDGEIDLNTSKGTVFTINFKL